MRKRSGESDEGQASTTGEKIKAPATGVNNAGADGKALRGRGPLSKEKTKMECAAYGNRAYSACASSTTGILGSAFSHSVKRWL